MPKTLGYRTISHEISVHLAILDIRNSNRYNNLPAVIIQWNIGLQPTGCRLVFSGIVLTLTRVCFCLQCDVVLNDTGHDTFWHGALVLEIWDIRNNYKGYDTA